MLRLISGRSEPFLSHTEKSCIVLCYNHFSTNIKIKNIKLIPVLLTQAFGRSGLAKLVLLSYPRKYVYNTMR